jgi:hypothetical protein
MGLWAPFCVLIPYRKDNSQSASYNRTGRLFVSQLVAAYFDQLRMSLKRHFIFQKVGTRQNQPPQVGRPQLVFAPLPMILLNNNKIITIKSTSFSGSGQIGCPSRSS